MAPQQQLQIPIWAEKQAAAERRDGKDPALCTWPGCTRQRAQLEGKRRPPSYCKEADEGEQPHPGYWASKAKARSGPDEPETPVTDAQLAASTILLRLEDVATTLPAHLADLLDALDTSRDQDALDLELGIKSSDRRCPPVTGRQPPHTRRGNPHPTPARRDQA